MIGTTLAHYRITAALGAGGMGEVYRATDTKLGRDVALKVLPAEFVDDPQRLDRFEREARAVASLNHPHIVTIHSVEEAEGVRFLTMELVDGRTLDGMIPENGFDIESFLELATPLAEAISAAHDKSVIHRDLKPSNVMVDGNGRVKVLDFGLAKLQQPEGVSDSTELPTEALTGIGVIVGTVPYMSPEQIEGEIVDHRTDIFSLGVLLFEMAIGERPFQGKSSPALMSSILKDAPRPVLELRPDLPRHLGRIIGRCLEKKRRDRYQTARDVFNELRALQRESSSMGAPGARPAAGPTRTAPRPTSHPADSSSVMSADEGFWVAVLPFKYGGGDADLTALAEGLSEDIVTGLSRFSYLRVVSRGSFLRDSETGVASVRDEAEASYVLEGSLRQAGPMLRVAVQLVDAATGAHLWAETYDRSFSLEALFELQDDLVPRIVSTVADMHGILPRRMSETVALKPADQLTPYEALLHSFGYNERFIPEALAEARSCLERAVEQSPGNADCWAMLSVMYSNEYGHWDNRDPEYFDKALRAARKAVLAAPLHSLPHYALAQAHFFRRQFPEARTAAERAVALNPMDGSTAAFMGLLIAYSGEWERGCALAERALELNPNLPGMFHYTAWHDAYRKEDYRRALELALKLNTPESFYQHAVLAMCYAQLGEMDSAHKSLRDMLALKPDYGQVARQLHGKWIQPDLVEQLLDGLRKAGLEIAPVETTPGPAVKTGPAAKAAAANDRRPGIAVLPFVNRSDNAENEYFSDGLTEELIADLAGIKSLSVISRTSAMLFKGTDKDLPTIGRELGVRYILEGSVRKSGSSLRVTAQLVDAEKDGTLWSEKFSGKVNDVFGIQEEIARKIVAALKVRLTDSEESRVVNRPIDNVVAFDCYLRARQEMYGWTPESLQRAALLVDQALGIVGENSLLLATRGQIEWNQANAMLDPDEGRLDEAADYARRALTLAPDDPLGLFLRGIVSGLRGDTLGALRDTLRAHQLRPRDSNILTEMCRFANASGIDVTDYISEMVRIDPLTPVTWSVVSFDHFVNGRIDEAVEPARRSLELASETSMVHIFSAWALAQAGLVDEAASILETAGRELAGTLHGTWALFLRFTLDGDAERAGVQMTPLLERSACLNEHVARMIADGYSLIGRNDEALRWIRIAMERGFINYPFLATYDPLLANVRENPRFEALMREVKTRWERLAAAVPPPLRAISPASGG